MQSTNDHYILRSLAGMTLSLSLILSACKKTEPLPENEKNVGITDNLSLPPDPEPQDKMAGQEKSIGSPFPSPPTSPAEKKKSKQQSSTGKRKPSLTEIAVESPASLPVDRLITDSAGRKLDVIITARYEKEIAVIRKKDSKTFELPIAKLSEEDIAFVLQFLASKKPKKADPFIVRREKMIEGYKKDIDRLRESVASGSNTTSQMRSKVKEQGRIKLKIKELKRQINEKLAQ